jgi:hypothetical protein
MVSFDATGTVRWIVPNETPQIATADGGVIAQPVNADWTIGPSATIYDQNGIATGQMASLPIQSWKGNAYQVGSTDQVAFTMIDIALSFNAFAYGSPSRNGTAVKVVRCPMFIPFAINGSDPASIFTITNGDRADVGAYYTQLTTGLSPTQVALYPLAIEQATAAGFFGAIRTTNTIVGFIDHGLNFDVGPQAAELSAADRYRARALCFWTTCLAPAALMTTTMPDGRVWTVGDPNGGRLAVLPDGFNPRATVVFLAACGIDEAFIAQWHLSNVGQALIVPVYTNPQMHLSLNWAANEWKAMLVAFAKGSNVQAAVAAGNAVAAQQTEHTWQIIGDPLVGFRAQFH